MSNDKYCYKTLSLKIQGFLGSDKPPNFKQYLRGIANASYDGYFFFTLKWQIKKFFYLKKFFIFRLLKKKKFFRFKRPKRYPFFLLKGLNLRLFF